MKPSSNKPSYAMKIEDVPVDAITLTGILRRNALIPRVIRTLIVDQAVRNISISMEEETSMLKKYKAERKIDSDEKFLHFLKASHVSEELLRQELIRPQKIVRFREEKWGPIANSLYLKNKERYDLVTYKRLQCTNRDLMQEVYFRLKDREDTWENMALQFGGGDTSATGKVGPTPITNVERAILDALRSLGPGRICQPIQLGEQVIVAELESFQPSKFNSELRERILMDEFDSWITDECDKALEKVSYPE